MKARTVIITLELETDVEIEDLEEHDLWNHAREGLSKVSVTWNVQQVQVNVAQPKAPTKPVPDALKPPPTEED